MAAEVDNQVELALKELGNLLNEVGEAEFASSMSRLRAGIQYAETVEERRTIVGQGLSFFGGMNSFNDLVIMRNGKADIDANRRLDTLRTRVYELLTQLL